MSTFFHVDTERVTAAAGDIARISADIDSQVAAMMARLNSLQDAWQGTAAIQFLRLTQEWQGTSRQVQQSLEHIGRVLDTAGARYAETEAAAVQMFS